MDSPRLPIELVEEIVGLFWSDDSLQVSPQDRATFIVSSLSVNRCWSTLFLAIASRDVYIPTPAFAFHLCDALQFHHSSQPKSKSKPLQFRTSASCSFSLSTFSLCSSLALLMPQRCRSLTFQYVGTKHPSQLFIQKQDYEHSLIGSSIFSLLRCLTPPLPSKSIPVSPLSPPTPHLHSISLDLHSCTTPSLFTYYKFHSSCFPPQVSSLSIHFHYPSSISPSTIEQEFLLDLSPTGVRKGCLEGVNELRLFGCSVGVVRDMVNACPAISRLETGSIVESLAVPSPSRSLSPSSSSFPSASESPSSSSSSSHPQIKPEYTSDLPLHLIPIRLVQAHQHAIAKIQQTQREIKLEAREIQREKWRRVGDAGEEWEEVVGALGLLASNGRNGNWKKGYRKKVARMMGYKPKKVLLLRPGPDMTEDLRARLREVEEKLARLLSRMESSQSHSSQSQSESSESDLDVAERAEADSSARDRRSTRSEKQRQKVTDLRLEKVFLEKWLWAIEEGERRKAERKGMIGRGLRRIITRMNVSTGFGLGLDNLSVWTKGSSKPKPELQV
ncbi:hypothetical protein K435DRAFT_858325 [Dendrothele bispora CBS 962.96]|uniref:Uncharacterized protein n=1 Tax=Dendrothele bispora (strain CBS 962.96) TaxID=1314807 RepID=A0A4S8M3G7_DENBC|nr:hypothetical protein K435DRAFT_858325 [Dendrothele bispora CBS 962.96]